MKDFYHLLVGLEIIEEDPSSVTLGFNKVKIIRLVLNSSLRTPYRHESGLYHSAILFSGRNLLANTIKKILLNYPTSYSGSADHLVSEAFYFSDPEGNGLELYYDKDSEHWVWKDGLVQMKVGSLKEAEKFYTEIIGFTKVSEFSGAIFF